MFVNILFNEKKMEEYITLYDDMLTISSYEDNLISDWIDKLDNNELKMKRKIMETF